MSSLDGAVDDQVGRTRYFRGDRVTLSTHADTVAEQVAYSAECEDHGPLMNGDWHALDIAEQAVREHLDAAHQRHVFSREADDADLKHASETLTAARQAYIRVAVRHIANLAREINPAAAYVGVNASSTYDKGSTWPTYHAEGIYDDQQQPLVDEEGEEVCSDHLDDLDTYVWDVADMDEDVTEDDRTVYLLNLETGEFHRREDLN